MPDAYVGAWEPKSLYLLILRPKFCLTLLTTLPVGKTLHVTPAKKSPGYTPAISTKTNEMKIYLRPVFNLFGNIWNMNIGQQVIGIYTNVLKYSSGSETFSRREGNKYEIDL